MILHTGSDAFEAAVQHEFERQNPEASADTSRVNVELVLRFLLDEVLASRSRARDTPALTLLFVSSREVEIRGRHQGAASSSWAHWGADL